MKKILTINVGQELKLNTDFLEVKSSLDEVFKWVNDIKDLGATNIQWDAYKDYDGDIESITATAYFERIETDDEYSARIEESNRAREAYNKNTEMVERKMLKELKSKYEPPL